MTWIPKSVPKPEGRGKRPPHPLKRSKMKTRGPRSKKSGGHLFPKGLNAAFRDWVRFKPCAIAGRRRAEVDGYVGMSWHPSFCYCWCGVEVAHVKSRGAGGPDEANIVPLCQDAHEQQHRIGLKSFERRWNISLKAEAVKLWREYQGPQNRG